MAATADASSRVPFPGRAASGLIMAGFTVLVAIDVATKAAPAPIPAATGAGLALGAAVPMFLLRSRPRLGLVPVATAGIVVLGNGDPRSIVWFALVVLVGWCVVAGGVAVGLAYWAVTVLVFGGEWLWAIHDPGWAPWSGGVTASVLAALLIRHELVLVARLQAAQANLAERSRAEERNRIARELHDVIAHSLTVSLLHVTSARLAVEHDPADAARALSEAERLGRQSLTEIRSTMGLLRDPELAGDRTGVGVPIPGLDGLPMLVDGFRQAGAEVCLAVDGDLDGIPGTAGSIIYRIVQEALTNAAKHAPRAAATVRVHAGEAAVDVIVDSAGPPGHGSGMGLANMAERAAALGGTCRAGPGGSGWLVHTTLPRHHGTDEGGRPR